MASHSRRQVNSNNRNKLICTLRGVVGLGGGGFYTTTPVEMRLKLQVIVC